MTARSRSAVLLGCVGIAAGVAGCGGDDPKTPDPLRFDHAFVARIVPHQHVALELGEMAARDARRVAVRRLARSTVALRRRSLPALDDLLARVPPSQRSAELGVTPRQAAEEVTPDALRSARPLDPAFLTVMTRHDQGALALVQAELRLGRDGAVKAAAQRLAADLTRELARISRALRSFAEARDVR